MPHGTRSGDHFYDDNGLERGKPIKVKLTFTIKEDGLIIDYTGSDKQQEGPMNTSVIETISVSRLMSKLIASPGTSAHEGSFRPLEVIAHPGCVFTPDSLRAPTELYGWPPEIAEELMFKTLAPVLPDRLPTCSGGDLGGFLRYRWHPKTDRF